MSKALNHLKELVTKDMLIDKPALQAKYDINKGYVVPNVYTTAKPETKNNKRIAKFLNLMPRCKCEHIINSGTPVNNGIAKFDFYTGKQTSGGTEYRRSTIQNGTADCEASIKGRTVDIEQKRVYKNGKDRQSDDQKEMQRRTIEADGLYIIVKSFEDFYDNFFWLIYERPQITQVELDMLTK